MRRLEFYFWGGVKLLMRLRALRHPRAGDHRYAIAGDAPLRMYTCITRVVDQ